MINLERRCGDFTCENIILHDTSASGLLVLGPIQINHIWNNTKFDLLYAVFNLKLFILEWGVKIKASNFKIIIN